MATRRERLAQRRKAVGFTQEGLAERLAIDRSTVVRWESGDSEPQPWLRPKIARALQVSLEQLAELLTDSASGSAVAALPTQDTAPVAHGGVLLPVIINGHPVLLPLDADTVAASGLGAYLDELRAGGPPLGGVATVGEREDMSPLSYRSLPTHGIAATALPGLGLEELQRVAGAMDDARRYLDGPVIDYFRRQLTMCKADDGSLGPAAALPVVLGILGAIEEHARAVTPDVRRSLLTVGADAAEFAGWLNRDLHDPITASFWHDRAIEWAQEAGDMPMQGYVLLKKSQMAYEERDGLRVLTFAQAAQYGPWQLPAKVRAEVTQQEARGMAMLGEPFSVVEQKLEDAQRLADAADTSDERYARLGTYYNGGTHLLRAASCYIEAGKPATAAALYGDVLGARDLSRRDEGYFRARRAAALAFSGEPDDAAHEGLMAMQLVTEMRSSRTRRELVRVVKTLNPWSNRPGPRALREALTS